MPLTPCVACGNPISPAASQCPKCGHPVGVSITGSPEISTTISDSCQQVMITSIRFGWEYKSKINILGLSLLHIASGIDPTTRMPRVARGIIAIGNVAIGLFALGGVALGGVTLGGLSIGTLAIGGAAVGGIALGGFAIGYVAVGGAAVGYYSMGGMALGKHAFGPLKQDPEAARFFFDNLGISLPFHQ